MKKYVVTTCSTIDLNTEIIKKYKINYISNIYYLDDIEYYDDISVEGYALKFYNLLEEGKNPKTTQINTDRFIKYFKTFLDQDLDILHLSFSSGLSGTYNCARLASEILRDEYPNNKIIVIDTLAASSGFGLLVTKALDEKEKGLNILELEDYVENLKLNINHWFYSTDLTYYIKGGRVTKTSGFIGNTLNICPILNVSNEGKLIPRTKVIGKKRVLNKILEEVNKNIDSNYQDKIYISHSNLENDAIRAKELLKEKYPKVKEIEINDIGPLIGSHTGPGTLSIFFVGKKREN